jgi:hypothetical protein
MSATEIMERLRREPQTAAQLGVPVTELRRLEHAGQVVRVGEERTASRGRPAIVWGAAPSRPAPPERVTISGRPFALRPDDVRQAVQGIEPEPIRRHAVVVEGRRFPPKQVLEAVTGLDRADFTTHQARAILQRLGFAAERVSPAPRRGPAGGRVADALRPFVGQWVALRGEQVIVAAPDAAGVVAWLRSHDQRADSMFRVPESEAAAGGLAPL